MTQSKNKQNTNLSVTPKKPISQSQSEISRLRYQNQLLKQIVHNMATGLILSRYPGQGINNRVSREYIYSKYACTGLMRDFEDNH